MANVLNALREAVIHELIKRGVKDLHTLQPFTSTLSIMQMNSRFEII